MGSKLDEILLVLIAALLGVGARTLVAWLAKIVVGEVIEFDQKFIATAILSVITVIFTSIGFVLRVVPINGDQQLIFLTIMFQAYIMNDLVNLGITTASKIVKIAKAVK